MANDQILEIIQTYLHNQPVLKTYLIGSYARNEADEISDVDLLMEFEPGVTLFDIAGIINDLEDALHKKVDVVSTGGLSPRLKPYIDEDKILIYEKAA